MKANEVERIYQDCCRAKGYKPNDAQCAIWRQTMGWAEAADLEQAIVYWFADNGTFPMPYEIKPLIERARRERVKSMNGEKVFARFVCPDCQFYRTRVGFLLPTDHEPRICQNTLSMGRYQGKAPEKMPFEESRANCGAVMERYDA